MALDVADCLLQVSRLAESFIVRYSCMSLDVRYDENANRGNLIVIEKNIFMPQQQDWEMLVP